MSAYELLAIIGALAVTMAVLHILIAKQTIGQASIAAGLAAGFAAFTAVTIYSEGVMPLWVNQTSNLWGVQVWWDLLMAVGLALFLIAPRARKMGMNVPLWTLFIITTASIGLLAMAARLFWLERAAASEAEAKVPS